MKRDKQMGGLPVIGDGKIVKRFESRQNDVYLVEEGTDGDKKCLVYKYHRSGSAEKEIGILEALNGKGVRVPRVIRSTENLIVLEYISEITLLDRLEYLESNGLPAQQEIAAITDFFASFYDALEGKIYWDINFKNFLFCQNSIWGVDFEDVRDGEKDTDMGRFAAFLLTYTPSFTDWKRHFLRQFVAAAKQRFTIDRAKMKQAMLDEFRRIETRRRLNVSPDDIKKITF